MVYVLDTNFLSRYLLLWSLTYGLSLIYSKKIHANKHILEIAEAMYVLNVLCILYKYAFNTDFG